MHDRYDGVLKLLVKLFICHLFINPKNLKAYSILLLKFISSRDHL